ncbi:TetR/AcrR family transcriptional regulator [Amycolatopsis minnesotensis]|uniref:TetR/AcrR family transcriptional regulator n=1 Tax=Amycolatopsis minnesotensis TaxID=337894 RepID=UPI003CD05EA2
MPDANAPSGRRRPLTGKVGEEHEPNSRLPEQLVNPLRADAARNRATIIAAAREVFTAEGLSTPLTKIVRQAGVGTAALYPRFPTRQALVAAVFDAQLVACTRIADEAVADDHPHRSFVTLVSKLCLLQVEDRAFTLALIQVTRGAGTFERARKRMERAMQITVARSQAAGLLRGDAHWTDVTLLILANAGVVSALGPGADTKRASRRLRSPRPHRHRAATGPRRAQPSTTYGRSPGPRQRNRASRGSCGARPCPARRCDRTSGPGR